MERGPASRRERQKGERRRHIIDAALQLLERQGVGATTIDQIAEEADVSRGTFFNYFPTKESLLNAIALEELADLEAGHQSEASAMRRIYTLMRSLMTDSLAFFQVTRYILLDAMRHSTEATSPGAHLDAMLKRLVQQAQAQGEIRLELDPAAVAIALVGVYLGAFYRLPALSPGGAQAPAVQATAAAAVAMLFDGIAGPAYPRR